MNMLKNVRHNTHQYSARIKFFLSFLKQKRYDATSWSWLAKTIPFVLRPMRPEYRSKWSTPAAMLVEMVAEINQWRKWRKQDPTLIDCIFDAALVHWLWWAARSNLSQIRRDCHLAAAWQCSAVHLCWIHTTEYNMYQHVMYWRCLKKFEAYAWWMPNWNVMRLFKLLPWMLHVWQNVDLHPLPIAGFTIPSLVTGATWPSVATAVSGWVDLA